MDNETIKAHLLEIEESKLDFTVTLTGKESKRVNGLYKPETREILLHNKNFSDDNELMYTAIHEYTHHLINEKAIEEAHGKEPLKQSRVHNTEFWARFHSLLDVAEEKGFYKMDMTVSPELEKLTSEIKTEYLEANGKLMVAFGKKLAEAHRLCEEAHVRYEDYLDRVLRLPRTAAASITKVSVVPVNPALGFENMKLVSSIKESEDRAKAEEMLSNGKSAETVRELMKRKVKGEDDQKERLEKEKNRLTKTISELEHRLEIVEEHLASL